VAELGYWAIALTLAVSTYTTVVSILGARRGSVALVESARNGAFVAAASSTMASAVLMHLLLRRDFGIKYVYEHVSSHLPTAYTVSAFWAGQEGSLLLWLWLLTLLTAAMAIRRRVRREALGPYALAVMAFMQAFLALILLLASDPFETLPTTPVEGQGLNPLLQNFWMIVHPPVVFASYAAYTAPFALALGGLITRQLGRSWVQEVRRWAVLAWLLLGAGILMGAWWAYLELGWGGYWGWDPVENSSLIPWLTGTALLHSLMMQRRRGSFKTWNLWLIALTFVLTIFATFVTRSGIIQSVHAFGRSSLGYYFLVLMALSVLITAYLVTSRRQELRNEQEVGSLFSREAALLITNLVLVGAALVVFIGTIFPALTETFQGREAALGASYYERTVGPLAQVTVLLIGICPWLAWGRAKLSTLRQRLLPAVVIAIATALILVVAGVGETWALLSFATCAFVAASIVTTFFRQTAARRRGTGENLLRAFVSLVGRNRARYGAYVVHFGIVLMAIGVTGSSAYQTEAQVSLRRCEEVALLGYTLQYQDLVSQTTPTGIRNAAVMGLYRRGKRIATLRPEMNFHFDVEQWITEVAIRSTLKEDFYVILAGLESDRLATFRVLVNPLVMWLWIGGGLLLAGGVMAWGPAVSGVRRR